jgi:uncharacterized lipoprotein
MKVLIPCLLVLGLSGCSQGPLTIYMTVSDYASDDAPIYVEARHEGKVFWNETFLFDQPNEFSRTVAIHPPEPGVELHAWSGDLEATE